MGPTPHHHPWDEAYYVLAGELDFQVGDRQRRVGAGDFVYAPGGTVHAFFGASEEPARLLIFDAPAHAEMFFKELEREVRQLPDDLRKMPAIGARHQVTFLPQAAAE
jgi:mannose-6-phosphate isomerase-like protein (cupin superfamily)